MQDTTCVLASKMLQGLIRRQQDILCLECLICATAVYELFLDYVVKLKTIQKVLYANDVLNKSWAFCAVLLLDLICT